ncbi:MAG: Re/Si-specific NAD(P)(+) transhydrogenase subunit alpha [Gemmatimonadales bacterium]|nr:Re/Si-specific NAD(P)(+) transhydrogenase subunit alpha [Gemmatimonadales bacterium]
MLIGIPAESFPGEARVAATPETVRKLVAGGHDVHVERGAGLGASVHDDAYAAAGALLSDRAAVLAAPLVLKVRAPKADEVGLMSRGATLVGMLDPFDADGIARLQAAGITGFALEAAPRITRAQGMDVLSSQANIAGYKAVILAANTYQRFFPMLMTAAGTVKAARVIVLGVGVAGLQAIATAKRLGAVIEASDVRPSVREQVESLGAKFIDVPFETDEERAAAEGTGGYARPMPQSWLDRQRVEVARRIAQADVVIATALIPGRAAPTLVTDEMVRAMKPGSVIVDLAAGRGAVNPVTGVSGGNCALSEPDRTVTVHGVTIIGETNLPAMVAADASALYARNILDFLTLVLAADGTLQAPMDDEIVAGCCITRGG